MKIIKTTIEADSETVIKEINAILSSANKFSPDKKYLSFAEIKKELGIKITDLQLADYLSSIGGSVELCSGKNYYLNGWFKQLWVLFYHSQGKGRFLAEKSHATLPYGTEAYKALLEWSKTTEKDSVKFESEQEAIDFRKSKMAAWNNVKTYQYADFEV